MKHLILDIETVGLPDARFWLDDEPITAPASYKDPVKIADYIAKAQASRLDKLALDIDCNRIVAFGWVEAGAGDPVVHLASNEFEEREGLKLVASEIQSDSRTRLVTFNGHRFDLPTLMRRAMYLDVQFPTLNIDRYRSEHLDLWQVLSFKGALSAHSLKFYAKRLGIGTLDKVSGIDIGKLVAEDTQESWQAIHDHVLSDIGLTHALAMRLKLVPARVEVAA
jgi:uncharacterized protein YprB with RNaseH-like and TPR domain